MIFADMVLESSTTEGTGAYALGGPAAPFRSFPSAFSAGDTVYYQVTDSAEGGTDFELVRGTLESGPARLTRDQVLASSNGGAPVNWPAGTRRIFAVLPAAAMLGMLTMHAGATEPAVRPRGVPWLYTGVTPHLLRVRDADAGDWAVLGSIDPVAHNFIPYRNGAALPGPGIAAGNVPVLQAGGLLDPARVPLVAAATELTIASGSITPTGHYHRVDTEGDAAADDVTNIATASLPDGFLLILRAENAARVPTFRSSGNVNLAAGDFAADSLSKRLALQKRGTEWDEVWRSHATVEPGRKARAGVRFDGGGTLAVNSSFGVDSVTDLGTGYYRITFTEAFANADYFLAHAVGDELFAGPVTVFYARERTTTYCDVSTYATAGGLTDARDIHVLFFED